jgi:hypothetical protein
MKTIRNKIKDVIQRSDGFPGYNDIEYVDAVRLLLNEELSNDELDFIESKKVDLNKWITDITKELTKDLF